MSQSRDDCQRIAAHLRTSPLFAGLEAPVIEILAAACRVSAVSAGQAIVEEGSLGETLYVLMKGRVRVEKRTPAEDSYTVTFLSAETGDFFGEVGLLDADRRSATVTAETPCEVIIIDRARFLAFGDSNPGAGLSVTRRIASSLAARLRRANDDVVTLFAALVQEVEERI